MTSATTQTTTKLSPMDMQPATETPIMPLRVARFFITLFSRVGKREPPSPEKTEHLRLISIATSHYVEKARWALDMLEGSKDSPLYYTEDLHAPAFTSFFTVPASKGQASQTPMIVRSDDSAMWGSDAILRELCSGKNGGPINLYPDEFKEEIMALEDELGRRIGASGRCYAYGAMLDKSKEYYPVAIKQVTLNCSKVEQKVYGKMFDKGIDKALIELMNISDEVIEASAKELRLMFAELSERLESSGSEYLVGNTFTAADLTFAALVFFIVRPPECGPLMVPEEEMPPKLVELFRELTSTKAGQHVKKIYKKHRPVGATGQLVLKNVNQNRNPFKLF